MGPLEVLVGALTCTMPAAACDAQARTGLDARFLYAICSVESQNNSDAYKNNDGYTPSYGACQIKLSTARLVGFTGRPEGLMEPGANYYYAAKYLIHNINRYHSTIKAISAYNAGHAISGNAQYVSRVVKIFNRLKQESKNGLQTNSNN